MRNSGTWGAAAEPADLRRHALFTILLPVALMLARTVVGVTAAAGSTAVTAADFIGDPVVALLIAVVVAMWTFGLARGIGTRKVNELVGASLAPAAGILLIIGAGGVSSRC